MAGVGERPANLPLDMAAYAALGLAGAWAAYLPAWRWGWGLDTYRQLLLVWGLAWLGLGLRYAWSMLHRPGRGQMPAADARIGVLTCCFGLLLMVQIWVILYPADLPWAIWVPDVALAGDMTLERVGAIVADGVFAHSHPLTGQPLSEGQPARLSILVLPPLYAAVFGEVDWWLWTPRLGALACWAWSYLAWAGVVKALWPENARRRWAFLLALAALVSLGAVWTGMEGHLLLLGGYTPQALRRHALLPLALAALAARRPVCGVLAVAAEAALVWTGFGLGYTALPLGIYAVCVLWRRFCRAGGKDGGGIC